MMIRVGVHISTRRGYRAAAGQARSAGLNAFQYFSKNPRSIRPKSFDLRDAQRCAALSAEAGIVSVAHGPYPINPAAEGASAAEMAASTLGDLAIAEACGSIGVIVHFGHYKGADPLQGYRNVIAWLNTVTKAWSGKAKVLLENQAGESGPFGTTPEECVQIRRLCDRPERIGFCLDTCHLFASGQWPAGNWQAFAERAASLDYWDALMAVHLNDSRHAAGSRRDRHAAIGEGMIGEAQFRALLATPEIRRAPLLLETPVGPDGTYREQLDRIYHWTGGGETDD